jgi:hypothetical protein
VKPAPRPPVPPADAEGVRQLPGGEDALGTINLVGFSREVMTDPRLVEALRQQADQDGQTVRLVKFARAEEVLQVRPCPRQGDSGGGPQVPPS